MKKVNEKNDDFLMKICGFWIDFEADFKSSILKQDKRVSRIEAGNSDNHRSAVPFGTFGLYSIFESAVPILLQITTKKQKFSMI